MATTKKVTVTAFNQLRTRVPSKLRMRLRRLEKQNKVLAQALDDLSVRFALLHPNV